MRNKMQSYDDTGEIIFDSLNDEFGDIDDFDENGKRFADEEDFDDRTRFAETDDYEDHETYEYEENINQENIDNEEFVDEDYYDEDAAGIYGGEAETAVSENDNTIAEVAANVQAEEYFDDHVEYFYDDDIEEIEPANTEETDFGTRASARQARENVVASGGVRVHKKPIVRVDNDKAGRGRASRKSEDRYASVASEDGIDEIDELDDDDNESKSSLGVMERIMIALAACVVLALIVAGGVILINKPFNKTESNINANGIAYNPELGGAGSEIAGISVIGGTGLQNAYDAVMNTDADADEDEEIVVEVDDYQEIEYKNEIQVVFETVSVVKDLKIKLINKKTGKLIANVPFVVTVTTPAGTIQTWTDSDKDGIIYYSDIAAGSYKLHLEALDETKYAGYVLPNDTSSNVKSEIAYEKVDVSGEILAAGDVNEATEDTIRDGADSGSGTLTNTVAWVESTKVDAGYYELPTGVTINNKPDLASADIVIIGYENNDEVVCEENGTGNNSGTGDNSGTSDSGSTNDTPATENKEPAGSVKDAPSTIEIAVGNTSSKITVECADTATVSCKISNGEIASADNSANKKEITVKGIKAGETELVITIKDDGKSDKEVKIPVKVTGVKGGITLAKTSLSVISSKNASVEVTLKDITAADVDVTSSVLGVATAAFDAEGKKIVVTGVAAGTANIVLTQKTDSSVTATIQVTVYASTTNLTATIDGTTIDVYVKDASGNYKKATYADYTATAVFYYYQDKAKYTGWQTIDGKTYYYTAEGKPVTGEQVINGGLYNFDSTGALVVGNGTLGIDVSKWNGDINWSKVKAAGVSYVIIRVGYRGSTLGGLIDDANFKKNIEGAQAAGLKVGVYFVTQAINDAEAVYEASMVIDRISKYTISYPVFLDVEASGGRGDKIDVATRTSVCKTFCKTIQNAGYTAGIYANKSWLTTKIDTSQLTGYKIWCAQYYTSCTYSGSYQMWQYTDSGTIDGISGKVDLNKSYLGY